MDSERALLAAKRYRFYAEELRSMAGEDPESHAHQMLLRAAEEYERMARTMDGLADVRRTLEEF
jgi:hypothetical protein